MEYQPVAERWEENGVLSPREAHIFTVQGTPILMHPSEVLGQLGMLWLCMNLARIVYPGLPRLVRWLVVVLWIVIYRATYFLHSIGHMVSGRQVGAPMDALELRWGTQLDVYLRDDVTRRQHVGRALGGPVASGVLTFTGYYFWRLVRRIPGLGWLARTWLVVNAIGLAVSLAPSPTFDGGTLLKHGMSQLTGDESLGKEAVQQAGFATVAGLAIAGMILFIRRRPLYGLGCWAFAGIMAADLLVLQGKRP
jgi:hypothetical protein